jgi:hypothetical protein
LRISCIALLSLCVSGSVWANDAAPWPVLRDNVLLVQKDSALDFSSLVEAGPAGKYGRVTAQADGHFTFAKKPTTSQRFLGATLIFTPGSGPFPDHSAADAIAEQARMRGYNLARFHYVDAMLMTGQRKDFSANSEQLDRFHYLLAALKKRGIYWMIDLMSSPNGAYGNVEPHRWIKKYNIKSSIYHDDAARDHWREWVKRRMLEKNPYTGLALKDDAALMGVVLMNEGGFSYISNAGFLPSLQPKFNVWLKKHYNGDRAKLEKAWGDVKATENWDQASILFPVNRWWPPSPRIADTHRFGEELQSEALAWMEKFLRGIGYAGMITSYNNGTTLSEHAARRRLSWIDQHAYHDHPSDFGSAYSQMQQISLLSDDALLIQRLATSRVAGKPFSVSEYGVPFWSRWRREAALLVPAYAGFHDWDMLSQYGMAIETRYGKSPYLQKKAIYPFGVGMDPIAHAGETMGALLYLRGDVNKSLNNVTLVLDDHYVYESRAGLGEIPLELSKLALVTGIRQEYADSQGPKSTPAKKGITFAPADVGGVWAQSLGKLKQKLGIQTSKAWSASVDQLRNARTLSKQNLTQASKGLYHTDTEQIYLDKEQRLATLDTPRTQGVSFVNAAPALSVLHVEASSTPATIAISSIDNLPLYRSARILLVVATDAQNTQMQFADKERKVLKHLGRLPVRLEPIQVSFKLMRPNARRVLLYALSLGGKRMSLVPTTVTLDGIRAELDTASLPSGPAVYFEFLIVD